MFPVTFKSALYCYTVPEVIQKSNDHSTYLNFYSGDITILLNDLFPQLFLSIFYFLIAF